MPIFSEEDVCKINVETSLIGQRHTELFGKIAKLSGLVKEDKAKEYLFHGVGRRLSILKRCIENVFSIFPLERNNLLSPDELRDVDINLHAFFTNIFGLFDNLAWVKICKDKIEIPRKSVGLFNKETQKYFSREFQEYLDLEQIQRWYEKHLKNYRDALSHRIPLYVPPKTLNEAQRKQEEALEARINESYKTQDFNAIENLRTEQDKIGNVCPFFIHSLSEEKQQVALHAQMIADFKTVEEVVYKYCEMMRV